MKSSIRGKTAVKDLSVAQIAPMAEQTMVITHSGRKSSVSVQGNDEQLKIFRQSLLKEDFVVVSEEENFLEFKRDIRLMAGDWPIKVFVQRDDGNLEISFFMFIPWSWIIVFGVMVVLFIPFATFQGAPLAFLLALGVVALASYKQRLDFSPNASWQGPPRKEWNDKMNEILRRAFGTQVE